MPRRAWSACSPSGEAAAALLDLGLVRIVEGEADSSSGTVALAEGRAGR